MKDEVTMMKRYFLVINYVMWRVHYVNGQSEIQE